MASPPRSAKYLSGLAGLFLGLLFATCPAAASDEPLAAVMAAKVRVREGTAVRGKASLPLAPVRGPVEPVVIALDPAGRGGEAPVLPAGDQLVIHKDDDFTTSPAFGWEGRVSVTACAAGPTDFLAFRFAAQDFARELPATIAGVEVGLDNRHGRTTWPLVGLAREDPLRPLQPDLASLLASVAPFSAPATTPAFPAPVGSGPDVFMRFPVTFPAPVSLAANLSVDDGMWSDAFDRPIDETLDNPSSDWIECSLVACAPNRLTVRTQRVQKTAAGDALGVKLAAAAVHAVRPVEDLDSNLRVAYDVSAATAQRAGLFFRLQSLSEFYFVEFVNPGQVTLQAQTPGGPVVLAGPIAAPGPSGTLEVTVTGGNPTSSAPVRGTMIEVRVNGSVVIPAFNDTVYAYTGVLSGLISLGGSTGEVWDSFEVRRNPDVFALLQFPGGEDAGVAAERSLSSAPFANVLSSQDGVTFTPLLTEPGCTQNPLVARPPNAFVGLVVRDETADTIDNLAQVEAKLSELSLACASCPLAQSPCGTNPESGQATMPSFEVGASIDVGAGWWNERAPDLSRLWLHFEVYDASCSAVFALGATAIASADVLPVIDSGQTSMGARFVRLSAPGLSFVPASLGEHCAMVIEYYDQNSDNCPDGWEGIPCPVGCACTTDPDQNPSTGVITRDFRVSGACIDGVSDLDRASLRAVKDTIAPASVVLSWQPQSIVVSDYNVHITDRKQALQDPTIRDEVPVWRFVPRELSVTGDVDSGCPGELRYIAVFEAAICPSSRSLSDP